MKCCAVCFLLLLSGVSASEVTPVQKVIQLMQGMIEKGKKEKHDEQVQFAAYKMFCDNTEAEKKTAIADATEQIEILKADIEQYAADAAEAAADVAKLEDDIATWEGDIKAATQSAKSTKQLMTRPTRDTVRRCRNSRVASRQRKHSTTPWHRHPSLRSRA
jgi:chromosome segregation ATPase